MSSLLEAPSELLAEWHPTLNGTKLPKDFTAHANKKAWWLCASGHEWEALISSRHKSVNSSGCPYCSGIKRITGVNDLAALYPDLIKEHWDFSKNFIDPNTISPNSLKRVWWLCSLKHSYEMLPREKTARNLGCPYCSGQRVLVGFNDLETTRPSLVPEWDDSKNGTLTIHDVSAGSNRKVWWLCKKGHSFSSVINKRSRLVGAQGCPFCSNQKVLTGYNDLLFKFPEIASEWDYQKNTNTPDKVSHGTHHKAWWICPVEGHSYEMRVNARTRERKGQCYYCSGQRLLEGFNDLLASRPDLAKEWDTEKNGDLTPNQVSRGSELKVWWKCAEGHSWAAQVYNRSGANATACAKCNANSTSKIQQNVYSELLQLIPQLESDVKLEIPFKKRRFAMVDMVGVWANKLLIVEYDGEYYHNGLRSGLGLSRHIEHDLEKSKVLLNAGYAVVRIRERDLEHLPYTAPNFIQLNYKPASESSTSLAQRIVEAVSVTSR